MQESSMGRQLTTKNNQFAPSGTITLARPIERDKRKFFRVWAPFWDIVIKDDKITAEKELDKKENWVWHCLWNDEVLYHISGEKVTDYQVEDMPPFEDENVWIPDNIRKALKKKLKEK
jgi:hypothetical protein